MIAAKKTKTSLLYEIPELTTITEKSNINIFNKDSELLSNTLGRSPSLL